VKVVEISNLVVARYTDGRALKGVTRDFSPNRAMFHIDPQDGSAPIELRFRQLKALFFVHSLEGDPARQDVRGFVHGPVETQQGKKIAVRFRDGEFICGYTLSWSPDREGFFMFPADVHSNNQRIYVITTSTLEVKAGPAAEVLAQRVLAEKPLPGASSVMRRPVAGSGPGAPPSGLRPMPPIGGRRPSGFLPRPPRGGGPERRTGSD
jgi:uncharacterized protein DUF6982